MEPRLAVSILSFSCKKTQIFALYISRAVGAGQQIPVV